MVVFQAQGENEQGIKAADVTPLAEAVDRAVAQVGRGREGSGLLDEVSGGRTDTGVGIAPGKCSPMTCGILSRVVKVQGHHPAYLTRPLSWW